MADKKKDHSVAGASIGGGAGLIGGLAIKPGRPYVPGEDLTGRRVIRPHKGIPLLQHEGIGIAPGQIAEVFHAGPVGTGTVQSLPVDEFAGGKGLHVIDAKPSAEAAARAASHIGEKVPYNILGNNCQTFSHCAVTGKTPRISRQVKAAGAGAAIGVGAGIIAAKLLKREKKHEFSREVSTAAHRAHRKPSQAQKEAGNYRMGHVRIHGLAITIENAKGTERRGQKPDGTEWRTRMAHHYGYIKGTEGRDGDHVDTFIGPNVHSTKVFIVDQQKADGGFDEHKVMLGFNTKAEARKAYLANYEKGWRGLRHIRETTIEGFKQWLAQGDQRKPAAADFHLEELVGQLVELRAARARMGLPMQPAQIELGIPGLGAIRQGLGKGAELFNSASLNGYGKVMGLRNKLHQLPVLGDAMKGIEHANTLGEGLPGQEVVGAAAGLTAMGVKRLRGYMVNRRLPGAAPSLQRAANSII